MEDFSFAETDSEAKELSRFANLSTMVWRSGSECANKQKNHQQTVRQGPVSLVSLRFGVQPA